jgi:thiosulfate/3-mercaptopyruvate sulfurtransferase
MKTTADPPAARASQGTGGEVLAGRQWLAEHVHDPLVRVVEVDVSPAAYNDWHIDGAVLWDVYSDLKDADYRTANPEALQRLITRSGISPQSTVVFYGYAPALGLWLMSLYGHRDVRVLDCSRDTWRAEGHPRTTTASQPPPGSLLLGAENPGIRASQATVLDAIGRPGTTLVDVRAAAEYRGECFWPSGGTEPGGRAGHVPSAVHQPVDGLYNPDGSFRPSTELRGVFSPAVLDGDGELITYCTIGGRAATAWFVLTHLLSRDRVRVYDGSWAEWGRTLGAPVTCP